MRAVKKAIHSNEIEAVDPQYLELASAVPEHPYDPVAALKLAEHLLDEGREGEAEEMLEAAARSLAPGTPAGLLIRLAKCGERIRSQITGQFAELALQSPELPEQAREEMEEYLDRFPTQRVAAPPEEEDAPEAEPEPEPEASPEEEFVPPSAARTLQVMEAVPTKMEASVVTLNVGGKSRNLDLSQIEAIAVAGVAPEGGTSFIIMDLLLDSPYGSRTAMRAVRLRSTTFDPRKLMGGEKGMEALRSFLNVVLEVSEGACLPDAGVRDGGNLQRFTSLDEYEREVLLVGT
jgi:hypothetical protein